jgi:ribosomal protein S18 acetylase RimI-like enzyme
VPGNGALSSAGRWNVTLAARSMACPDEQERSVPQPELTLRRATPGDAQSVCEITDLAYTRYLPILGRKPQPMTADHQAMITEHKVWLLVQGEAVLAALELIEEPDCMLIYSVAVRPEHQRRGYGRKLLAWAEVEAARADLDRIRLYTNALMEDNIRLYCSLGYEETGREPCMGSTLVHMAKLVARGT